MNAVITGITGLRNRGVEALVVPTIEQLQKRQPDLGVNILTTTPAYDRYRLQSYRANTVWIDFPQTKTQRLRARFSNLSKKLAPSYQVSVQTIRNASAVIASGGDVFSSDYNKLDRHLQPLEVALQNGVPVVFLAQSIGPFKRKQEAEAWLKVARRATLITIREKLSYDYVTKTLGLAEDFVKLTADPAFLLNPLSAERVTTLRRSYGIDANRPVVAIAVSKGISRYAGCSVENHLNAWRQIIHLIINEFNAQILLVPHVQDVGFENNDRILASELIRMLDFNPDVHLAGADHSASEFKGLIGSCNMVIAERMHAAIAGLSSGVCTVAVGYSVKAEGIMTDLLGTTASQNGLLVSIQQFLDQEVAQTAIRKAWSNRDQISAQLNQVLPRVKQESARNFDLIAEILK